MPSPLFLSVVLSSYFQACCYLRPCVHGNHNNGTYLTFSHDRICVIPLSPETPPTHPHPRISISWSRFYHLGHRTFNGGASDALYSVLAESISVSRKSQKGPWSHSIWWVFHSQEGKLERLAGMKSLLNLQTPDFQKDLESLRSWLWLNMGSFQLFSSFALYTHDLLLPSAAWLGGSGQVLKEQSSWVCFWNLPSSFAVLQNVLIPTESWESGHRLFVLIEMNPMSSASDKIRIQKPKCQDLLQTMAFK